MAAATATLTLRLRDLASSQFRKVGTEARGAMDAIRKSGAKARKAFDLAGNLSLAASGLQQAKGMLDGITTGPVDEFREFEFQMARVGQLSGKLAAGEFEQLNKKAIELGESTFFTGMEAAQGLEQLAVAGFNAKEQLAAIQPVLRLSQASGADLGRTADIASDLLGGFGLKAQDTGHLTDVLSATFMNSTTTLETLFESLKLSAPIANQAGISLEKLSVLTGLLGNAGIKGSLGGVALRGALLGLTNPSKQAGKALRRIGLDPKFVEKNLSDPVKIVEALAGKLEGLSGTKKLNILGTIFGRKQAGAVGILVDAVSNGAEGFDKLTKAVAESEGVTEKFGLAMEATAKGKTKILESQISKLRLELGERMLPVMNDFMELTRDTVKGISDWTQANPGATRGLSKFAITAGLTLGVLIPLTFALQSMITLWGISSVALVPLGAGIMKMVRFYSLYTTAALKGGLATTKLGRAAVTTGGAMSAAVGLMSAAFIGWEIGTWLDEAIGGFFDFKDGMVSAQLAMDMGKWEGLNDLFVSMGQNLSALGLTSLGEGVEAIGRGNRARNETDKEVAESGFDPRASLAFGQPPPASGSKPPGKEFTDNVNKRAQGMGRSQVDLGIKVDSQGRAHVERVRTDDRKGPKLNVGAVAQ